MELEELDFSLEALETLYRRGGRPTGRPKQVILLFKSVLDRNVMFKSVQKLSKTDMKHVHFNDDYDEDDRRKQQHLLAIHTFAINKKKTLTNGEYK